MLALVCAVFVAAAAPTAAELLNDGQRALDSLEYDQAADLLMRAASAPDATPAEQMRANLLAGIANRIAGRDVDAHLNFKFVLLEAPETTLPPSTPPKVMAFFELVRRELIAEGKIARRAPANTATANTATANTATANTATPNTATTAPDTVTAGAVSSTTDEPFPLGFVVVGASAVVALGGAVALVSAESTLAQPQSLAEREQATFFGELSTVALGLGLVGVGAGALWALGVMP